MSVRRDFFIEQDDLTIRPMRDGLTDFAVMARWLTNERVLEFYEGRDNPFPMVRVQEEFGPRARGEEPVVPCMLVYQDRAIGYLQYYPVTEEDRASYGFAATEGLHGLFGVDLFIGEPECWNQGIGTKALSALVRFLFQDLQAEMLVVDPQTWNTRAIRCYEKCGFRRVKLLPRHELHEGAYRDAWLMTIERAAFLEASAAPSA